MNVSAFLLIGAVGAALLMPILAIFLYNGLVIARNRTREAWSGVEVQLKRRASLIPNLVESVRAYASHEHAVFAEVSQARGAMAKATGPVEVAAAEPILASAMGRLMAVAEAYPQLQAVGTFAQLQEELSDTEEKIAYARQFYNQNVLGYNSRIQTFPGNQFASWWGFQPAAFFEGGAGVEQDVTVKFAAV